MKYFMALMATVALAALTAGCSGGDNANAYNANRAANSNTAVVVNTNTTANANTKRAPTKEEVAKDKERYEREAKGANRKVGTGANDMWLWVKTRYELAAADDLKESTIDVDVDNAVVTLSGSVSNNDQVKRADAIAKGVEGVKSVQNKLKVAAGTANANKTANTKK